MRGCIRTRISEVLMVIAFLHPVLPDSLKIQSYCKINPSLQDEIPLGFGKFERFSEKRRKAVVGLVRFLADFFDYLF